MQLKEKMEGAEDITPWDVVIRPRKKWLQIPAIELWRARELVGMFVWRDFVATYKQTVLGSLWYLIQPILTSITYLVIFGILIGLPTGGIPPFLFYLSGTVVWNYFASTFTKTSSTFVGNAQLFQKVYFPRLAVPVSVVFSNLISFGIQFAIFLVFLLFFQIRGSSFSPNIAVLLLPILLLIMAGLGLGFGLIITALTTKYRDFHHLITFGTQIMLYATPVIYPISIIPERFRWIIWMNPLSSIVETFRFSFLGAGSMNWGKLGYSFLFMIVTLLIGLFLFNRVESTFVDTV
jgi:lipopolysaccharide transport system permease protein